MFFPNLKLSKMPLLVFSALFEYLCYGSTANKYFNSFSAGIVALSKTNNSNYFLFKWAATAICIYELI